MICKKLFRRLVFCVLMAGTAPGFAEQSEFPFDGELILDVRPMPGSKRIPNMDISADGKIALEMWCNRADGQVVVAGDTITVMIGPPTDRACTPDRARSDAELIDALNAVSNWRREGDFVRLIGPKTLRFRVPTN
jgi:heat shock protein HslJ